MQTADAPRAAGGPRFYSAAEIARMFGISRMTVYRAINSGELAAVRIRGRLFVPDRAVEALVEAAVAGQAVVAGRPAGPVAR
jgi:excisionase family DNA binding protein